MTRTLLLFVDGFGWGGDRPEINPQCSYGGELLAVPRYRGDAGSPLWRTPHDGWARPIDAVLGVDGVPQSATGQTTLLTGINAQADLGQHLTGFPNDRLREILLQGSLLRSFTAAGRTARFLNAFRPRFFELPRERQLHFSATTVATLAADVPFFDLEDIGRGRSVYQEFTNAELIERGFDVAPLTPEEAGSILGRECLRYEFSLYEYFQTDRAGHSQDMERCREQLLRLETFVARVLQVALADPQPPLVVLTSDHGNLEDLSTRRHTTGPVPLIAWGEGAREFVAQVERLDQVAGAIRRRHGLDPGAS